MIGQNFPFPESTMTRSLQLLAFAILAAAATAAPALAGSAACCGCNGVCPVVQVLEPSDYKPIYVVNQGPTFSGYGIVTAPATVARIKVRHYPYAGHGWQLYRPYDGGPYSDPTGHRMHYIQRVHVPVVVKYRPAAPRIVYVDRGNKHSHKRPHRRLPDPGYK
jgi:hypothetical protein